MITSMGAETGAASVPSTADTVPDHTSNPQEIKADVAATRAELADTLAELRAKADVKARAGKGVEAVKDRTMQTANQVRDTVWRRRAPLVAIAIGALAALAALGIRKRQSATANNRRWWPW
jgi:Protein of unknown function (DUF3618)